MGEGAHWWVSQQGLFDGGDLVALGPAIGSQVGFALFDCDAHAKGFAFDRGHADYANIEGIFVDGVNGEHDGRVRLIGLHDINVASFGIPA